MKVADYIRKNKPKKVCLIFWHGLGDLLMFMTTFQHLQEMFPGTQIDIALQKGVGQQELIKDAVLISNPNLAMLEYDQTFPIHYHMSEHLNGRWTKNEWCCIQELGIDPIWGYPDLHYLHKPRKMKGKYMVSVHFQATALPGECNPTSEVAHEIWADVIEAGFIPIETHFQHVYHNPVNKEFPFVPKASSARHLPATIKNLMTVLGACHASIGVSSGNFHMGMAIMPHRTAYIQKKFDVKCYTKEPIPVIDGNTYSRGPIIRWLHRIST